MFLHTEENGSILFCVCECVRVWVCACLAHSPKADVHGGAPVNGVLIKCEERQWWLRQEIAVAQPAPTADVLLSTFVICHICSVDLD